MPTRMIRDGILASERVNLLSERAELFYRRLMSVVDDYGRFSANLTLLRSACYPLKVDSVKEDSIKKHLAEAASAGLIVPYTVGGKEFLEIQDFGQRIQSKSKYPEPLGIPPGLTVNHGDPPEKTAPVVVVVGVEDVGVARKGARTRKAAMPPDFALSDRVRTWAAGKGFTDLEAHFESFVGKARKGGYAYADWDEAFMEAVREDWAKLRVPRVGAGRKRVDL